MTILRRLFFLMLLSLLLGGGWFYYSDFNSSPTTPTFQELKTSLISPTLKSSKGFVKKTVDTVSAVVPLSPCKKTLYYSFGKIDERHNIAEDELLLLMQSVENIWEKPVGYNLFEYKPDAKFKINFIFDERQEQTNQAFLLDNKLSLISTSQKNLSAEYKELSKKYTSAYDKYKSSLKKLEEDTMEYNSTVSYWNTQGGAPKDEFEKLKDKEEELEELADKVEKRRQKVNALAKEINSLAEKEKTLVNKYNTEILTYKNKYGESKEFSQGEYFGDGINIYQFRDKSDLLLALAHEFGHALGIGHVKNSHSIMYYLMDDQDLNKPELTTEDLGALNSVCSK